MGTKWQQNENKVRNKTSKVGQEWEQNGIKSKVGPEWEQNKTRIPKWGITKNKIGTRIRK